MSTNKFILLIITILLAIAAIIGFFYFQSETVAPEDEVPGINFISQFNPFGTKPTPPTETPPIDVPEYIPETDEEIPEAKLMKISSMPIAGFTVFTKERLKEVAPIVVLQETEPIEPYNFGSTILRNGSEGEAVKEIQRFFNNTLNLSLELDGVLDEEVTTTIKQWQSTNNLVADGIVGAKTKAIMYSSVNQEAITTKPTPPPTEFMPALRYVDRATGNIYQTFVDKIEEKKFSTTIIPKVYEAYFGNRGQNVIMRYLKENERTIETFVGTLPEDLLGEDATENNEIEGSFLPNDIKDISLSFDNSKIFYLWNIGENMMGTTLNLTNNKKIQLFESPFTEWLSYWPNSNTITLTTKPSASIPGYMYTINSAGKNFTKILGDINGLTTLGGPDGKLILFSDNNLALNIYKTDTGNSDLLGIRTLPEKCIWNKTGDTIYCAVPKLISGNNYPDIWYQGEISFNDQFWKIDLETGNGTLLLDPVTITGGEEIDGIKLALDEEERYLFFVNKKDSFLWKLELEQAL